MKIITSLPIVSLLFFLASCSLESSGEIQLRHVNLCNAEHTPSKLSPKIQGLISECNNKAYYLVNTSKDEIIKFTVCKEDETGKVDYSEHVLEPTAETWLGCKCQDSDVYKMYVKRALLIKTY